MFVRIGNNYYNIDSNFNFYYDFEKNKGKDIKIFFLN